MAQLYFKYGAMGSSKTANALMTRFNYEERGQKTLLVKPRIDTRDGDHMVVSRIGLTYPCIYFDELRALSVMELSNCDLELADSLLVCHIYHIPPFAGENKLLLFNARGQAVDSVIFPWAEPPVVGKQLVTIYLQGDSWDRLILEYTDRSHWVWALDGMEVQDGRMTYRPAFSDTLYALSANKLQPWVALHTGKYRFPDVEGRTVTSGYSDKLVANRIQVTPENIYFTCELDTYDEQELFEGIYDRRTGRTRLSPASHEGYTDDLTGFMPVPRRYPHGVQVSLIEAYKVVEWLDEHPEARSNPALAGLAQVKEEDNPVAVFVRYK